MLLVTQSQQEVDVASRKLESGGTVHMLKETCPKMLQLLITQAFQLTLKTKSTYISTS